jgi:hypothetical protein
MREARQMLTGNDPFKKRPLPPDRRKKGGSFVRAAGSFVPKIAAKAFEKFGFHTAEIMMQWPTIAGKEIAAWTQPERIRWPRLPSGEESSAEGGKRPGGTLFLRVEPARALDVEYRAAEIIERINRYFGYRAVETLKIIQAPLSLDAPSDSPVGSRPHGAARLSAPSDPVSLPADILQAGEGKVPDDLKAALAQLWTSVTRSK